MACVSALPIRKIIPLGLAAVTALLAGCGPAAARYPTNGGGSGAPATAQGGTCAVSTSPLTTAPAAAATSGPTFDNGTVATPTTAPKTTSPLPCPIASFPNTSIQPGLAQSGTLTYAPPQEDTPTVSQSTALTDARVGAPPYGGAPKTATLALVQYTRASSTQPFLAWVVDCTPPGPSTFLAVPSNYAGATAGQFHFVVVLVYASGPEAGTVAGSYWG